MLAEDIFQDTFIKVVHTLNSGKYNEEGKFLPWVMRIAHNLVIDYFRKNKKMPSYESENEDFDIFSLIKKPERSAEDLMIENQMIEDIHTLITKLPKDQKDVLLLRTYADLSFIEIAEQTNVSINTALGRMRYALINLRKLMKEKEDQELEKSLLMRK
jgi:RNA polymerase sigma-70 factor (ECF subfamily)